MAHSDDRAHVDMEMMDFVGMNPYTNFRHWYAMASRDMGDLDASFVCLATSNGYVFMVKESNETTEILAHTIWQIRKNQRWPLTKNIEDSGDTSARMVRVCDVSDDGFVFCTGKHSRKSASIANNPRISMCFYWANAGGKRRQVRVDGQAVPLNGEELTKYWNEIPIEQQLYYSTHNTGTVITDREVRADKNKKAMQDKANNKVLEPDHWCGYCLKPESFEFFSIDKGKHSDRVYFFLPEDGKVTPGAQPTTAEAADMCGLEAEGSWLYMLYE